MDDIRIDIDSDLDERVRDERPVKESALDAANRIAEVARGTAPVASGDYQAGIVVQETTHGARVYASDYKSAWIEFGVPSRGEPAHFNLRKAAESAGYKFKKRDS